MTGTATADHRCVKTEDLVVAAGHSVDPARWQEAFEVLMGRIACRFARVEPRRRVRDLVLGLLSDFPRKNCWPIAGWAGETSPDGMQHLLGRARWDADRVRDDVREYVLEHLHDEDAVLVVDETGDVKKVMAAFRGPVPDSGGSWCALSCRATDSAGMRNSDSALNCSARQVVIGRFRARPLVAVGRRADGLFHRVANPGSP